MSDRLGKLFNDFDRGYLTRRQLLQALGIGVAVVARPMAAFAQGSCGGQNASLPRCNPTPAKLPFEPTGWKTVLLDHFSMQVADYKKEAAYFNALMNWKIRSDDGTEAVLDIGDWGALVIKGGYQPPAPPPQPIPAPAPAAAAGAGATPPDAAATGRGGGRGGGGRGGGAPRQSVITGFSWGIAPWDTRKVEAELKKRGLTPIADHDTKNHFESFHVKDPGGFDLQITNGNSKNRRTKPANGSVGVPAPFDPTPWKTVWLDHISFQVADYKASAAFYIALLGWKSGVDEGSLNQCQIGDVGDIIIRGGNALDPNFGRGRASADGTPGPIVPPRPSAIDHIAFGISPFDPDAVKAEFDKRGLSASIDTGGTGDIHVTKYKSYHTNTPNGFNLQISNLTLATRGAL
jgi:catechol 2,3-dioxygenase-like lactoylglutathione lyase family enzyme